MSLMKKDGIGICEFSDREKERKVINSFDGKYYFLSNFFQSPVEYEGLIYQSSEAAFQAAKTRASFREVGDYLSSFGVSSDALTDEKMNTLEDMLTMTSRLAYTRMNPSEAKKYGRRCKLRLDWEDEKIKVMEDIVFNKFQSNDVLKEKLLDTGDALLIEGNDWNDKFWGVCNGEGENHLGKILMNVRTMLRIEEAVSSTETTISR